LAVPIVATNALQSAYQLIDAFWVGRLGGAAVAAVSVSFPAMFLSFAIGSGLSMAGSTLIAQYVGARNEKMVGHVAGQTLLMIVAASLVLGTAGFLLTPTLLRAMGVQPEVYAGAVGFMRVSFVGVIFNFTFFVFQSIMRGVGRPTLPVFIVLGTVVMNFVLNPVAIFGWGPIPGQGVMGAALVTLLTQAIASSIGVAVLWRGSHGVHIGWPDLAPDPAYIRRAFALGFPASIEMSARAFGFMAMTFLVTSFGTLTLAAYGVGSNLVGMVIVPAIGLSLSVSTLVGQNIGAGNVDRAGRIGRISAALGFGWMFAAGLFVFFFAHPVVAFFVPRDPAVIAEGARFLRIMALSWGFMGIQFALTGALRGAGSMTQSMMLTVLSLWVLQLPAAWLLSHYTALGSDGLWWSVPIANVLASLTTVAVYARGDWRHKKLLSDEERLAGRVNEEILADDNAH
ncbi:MAG: MATE family efflux transporter, partial [Alphaproteobacteria bacterium]|nr:MATE family efflux transporter [Alphaproteobacteria bacterium]